MCPISLVAFLCISHTFSGLLGNTGVTEAQGKGTAGGLESWREKWVEPGGNHTWSARSPSLQATQEASYRDRLFPTQPLSTTLSGTFPEEWRKRRKCPPESSLGIIEQHSELGLDSWACGFVKEGPNTWTEGAEWAEMDA